MKQYVICFKNADGENTLTREINAPDEATAIAGTTDYVRKNFIAIYITGPIMYIY